MTTTEPEVNGFGDNVRIEPVSSALPVMALTDVSGDEEQLKEGVDETSLQCSDQQPNLNTTTPMPEELKQDDLPTQSIEMEDQETLLSSTVPRNSADLDIAEPDDDVHRESRMFHLGPTNSLTQATIVVDNWLSEWITYILSHGFYMAFLSFIYLILVYASLEMLYYMTSKNSS